MCRLGQSSDIRIMQLNAENLFIFLDKDKSAYEEGLSESQWQALSCASVPNKPLKKLSALSEVILDVQPHILALNEVGGQESLHHFNTLFLDGAYDEFLVEGNSDRGIDVGYLVRKDFGLRAELISHKERPLQFLYPHEKQENPNKPSHLFSRDCAELRLFQPDSLQNPFMILFLVHLKSKLDMEGIDPSGTLRREAEVKTLVKIYRESQKEFPGVPRAVVGDFNGVAQQKHFEPEFEEIYRNTDLRNALELCDLEPEFLTTQVQFRRGLGRQLLQLDYIFLCSSLQSKIVKEDSYVYRYKNDLGLHSSLPTSFEEKLAMPSDHYPVIVSLKF